MKSNLLIQSARCRQAGSAMLLALMIMGVATMGVAAWITIINGRGGYAEALEDGMRRRVAIENSRQIAEEYIYNFASSQDTGNSALFPVNASAHPADDSAQPDIVERVQIASWTDNPLSSVFQPGRASRFSPANGYGYFKKFSVLIGKGSNQLSRDFEVRSRSPILAGDLLIMNRPTITPGNTTAPDVRFRGHVRVNGRTVFYRPDMLDPEPSNRFRSKEYALMSGNFGDYPVKDLNNNRIRPSNFPFTPTSGGAIGSGALGFDGSSAPVDNTYVTVNSIRNKLRANPIEVNGLQPFDGFGVVSNASGRVTIDLNDSSLNEVLIHNDTSRIVLNGQTTDAEFDAADSMSPVVIVIIQDKDTARNLGRIELNQRNNRRLIVAIKTTIDVGDSATRLRLDYKFMNTEEDPPNPFPTWRLIGIHENTEVILTHATTNSEVTIFGGFRTDRGLWATNNPTDRIFNLEREPNPLSLMERYLDRNVWLESYPTIY